MVRRHVQLGGGVLEPERPDVTEHLQELQRVVDRLEQYVGFSIALCGLFCTAELYCRRAAAAMTVAYHVHCTPPHPCRPPTRAGPTALVGRRRLLAVRRLRRLRPDRLRQRHLQPAAGLADQPRHRGHLRQPGLPRHDDRGVLAGRLADALGRSAPSSAAPSSSRSSPSSAPSRPGRCLRGPAAHRRHRARWPGALGECACRRTGPHQMAVHRRHPDDVRRADRRIHRRPGRHPGDPAFGWQSMFLVAVLPLVVLVPLGNSRRCRTAVRRGKPSATRHGFRRPASALRTISMLFALATIATLFAWYGLGTWLPNLMQGRQRPRLRPDLRAGTQPGRGGRLGHHGLGRGALRHHPDEHRRGRRRRRRPAGPGRRPAGGARLRDVRPRRRRHARHAVPDHRRRRVPLPGHLRGTALGWALGTGRIGAVAAPQIGGRLLAAGLGANSNFVLFAVSALVASLLLTVVWRRARRQRNTPRSRLRALKTSLTQHKGDNDVEPRRNTVIIAGGGIGGAATALALARGRAGDVVRAGDQVREVGAGLQIGRTARGSSSRGGCSSRFWRTGFSRKTLCSATR